MESKTFWIVVCLGGFFFFSLLFGFILNKVSKEDSSKQRKSEYQIYHMKYGSAYCGEISFSNCGITLRKCTDDKEYYCLQDVSVEMEK